ncbi:helix-turn-helix domain-containing protein [Paralcaligenes sp. KSB-10]|jgi:cytoskeletal protein RodZ|uniref:helix-turn-helix domain-containing protein n=1 Tax=Paralcaligenes sp. KSB-10 TaxID=2901142 RepID=UPI001E4BBF56|nr:helix-turn-helix transcriptional regulator [Paralcaligenes sp. KSB-10]UHL65113.1 helix-turn-helix domain-containing protein [Paralcaligenes sp. KSB-10]
MIQPLRNEAESSPAALAPMGVGATLKSLREAKQLSLGDVSARLKFSTRQLGALEGEQWDDLPTGVSLRGFVKNYGRFLETDTDALVSMLDSQVGSTGARPIPVSSPASLGSADLSVQSEPVHRPWGWLIIILILLIVAGFYAIERNWVPDSWLVFDWLKSLKK